MSKNRQLFWRYFATSVFFCILSTATPEALDSDALQQMGLLLGLPMGRKDASLHENIPKFVMDIHDCWNSNQSDDCLPGYPGTDVNQLRASLGTSENQSALPALHSFNKNRELINSFPISFNVSLSGDILRYAMLRVYREPVDELALLQNHCSDLSELSLQLYTQTSTDGEHPVFTLSGVQSLSQVNVTQGGWVEFLNLTNIYKSLIDAVREELGNTTAVLNIRLAVSAPSCSNLTPSALGFTSVAEHRAQLVSFEENAIGMDVSLSDIMSFIARSRRSAGDEETTSDSVELSHFEHSTEPLTDSVLPTENPTHPSATEPLSDPSEYQNKRCALYRHYISFASLGWDQTIVSPSGFTANFCAGSCIWPPNDLRRINRHAYIQSHANFLDPSELPPPCCVPSPDGFLKISVAMRGDNQDFVIRIYHDMVATRCACW